MNLLLSAGIEKPEIIVILSIFGVFIGSILTVLIIKFIKVCIKQIKTNKKYKNVKAEYLPIFGNAENVIRIERKLNRILVEVKDIELVDLEMLKNLNVGAQITGNIIKCSSVEMADELEKFIKK